MALRTADEGLGEPADVDVLLVGGPTHAHGASVALKEALSAIPSTSLKGVQVATFDTRFQMSRFLTGSAANSVVKVLKRAGGAVVAPPESFFVTRENPPVLLPGEIDRAKAGHGRSWARKGARASGPRRGSPPRGGTHIG